MSATAYAQANSIDTPLHVNRDVDRAWSQVVKPTYAFNPETKASELKASVWDNYNEYRKRLFGDASVLGSDEITKIKKQIMSVLRWAAVSPELINTIDIGPGMTKLEYWSANDVFSNKPRMTQSFKGGYNVVATKSSSTVSLWGLDYDISIDKVTLDAGNNSTDNKVHLTPSLQSFETQQLLESLIQYREWYIHRGTDIPNFTDIGIKGICNWTGVTDPGALGLGADDNLTAAGDIDDAAMQMASSLIDAKFKPPFKLRLSPKIYAKAHRNKNATTGVRDIKFINDAVDEKSGSKMFDSVDLDPYLIDSVTETTSTGAMLCMKMIPEYNYVAETYPLGVYPLQTGSLGWDAKFLWMGGTILQRPTAVCFRDSLTSG